MKTNKELLQSLIEYLDSLTTIIPEEIPEIDLYMDQVTTFMDTHLASTKRIREEKILTKTMINNYAKNNLLPPPEKKKYSKNHILMLILIYYFKNILTFNDIEQIFAKIGKNHFAPGSMPEMTEVYTVIQGLEDKLRESLKSDLTTKFELASVTFKDAKEDDQEYLRLFAFICELAFDVYVKKQMLEMMAMQLTKENEASSPKKKD